eukprot:GHVP01004669.1.p1 GENE.GHVP01004669.1~~GHVP01004669.1.p1  ORF type:complete len:183 (-),score=43.32 GHVP01004669.1:32-580(-)
MTKIYTSTFYFSEKTDQCHWGCEIEGLKEQENILHSKYPTDYIFTIKCSDMIITTDTCPMIDFLKFPHILPGHFDDYSDYALMSQKEGKKGGWIDWFWKKESFSPIVFKTAPPEMEVVLPAQELAAELSGDNITRECEVGNWKTDEFEEKKDKNAKRRKKKIKLLLLALVGTYAFVSIYSFF